MNKFAAWEAICNSVLHGASNWAISQSMLQSVERWELHFLRKIFWWRGGWSREQYMKYSTRFTTETRKKLKVPNLSHRLLNMYFKQIYKAETGEADAQQLLKEVRAHKDKMWFEGIKKGRIKKGGKKKGRCGREKGKCTNTKTSYPNGWG